MNVLAIIPARGGSTRLTNKNLQRLGGQTLVELAYCAAEQSAKCTRIVVSTDTEEMACGFDWIQRPDELSGPTADISQAIQYTLIEAEKQDSIKYDYVVTLQPTIPCRPNGLIASVLKEIETRQALSAVTILPTVPWVWKIEKNKAQNDWTPKLYPRSQDVTYQYGQELNCLQLAHREVALQNKRWQLPLLLCTLPPWAFIDIDDEEDLKEARRLWPLLQKLLKEDWVPHCHEIHSINGYKEV